MAKDKDNWSHKNDYPIEEIWNTNNMLAQDIAQRLTAFKALEKHGHPADIKDMRKWNNTIQKMIDAFELMKYSRVVDKNEQKAIDEGLQLFCEYFSYLWD